MTHHMKLAPGPFEKMRSGQKSIELRLWDEKRSKLSPGDTLIFTRSDDESRSLRATVKALHRFPSFRELYAGLPLEKCGYSPQELPQASYRDMEQYYSAAQQALYGVVGIELELL